MYFDRGVESINFGTKTATASVLKGQGLYSTYDEEFAYKSSMNLRRRFFCVGEFIKY